MRTLFISMVLTPGGSSGPPAMLMPGWFAPIVGARSALRLSLSYCAWNKRRALCYRTATCFADKFQSFSFWYSLSLSLEDSWRSLFLSLSKSKSRSRSARSKGCLNHRCRSQVSSRDSSQIVRTGEVLKYVQKSTFSAHTHTHRLVVVGGMQRGHLRNAQSFLPQRVSLVLPLLTTTSSLFVPNLCV